VTAKAFDDRMKEAEDIVTAIGVVKSYLSDVKEELKSKLDVSALEATTLSDNFKILEKTIENNFNVMGDVKELMEIVNREFERIHGTFDDVKVQQEQKSTEGAEKHDATREAIIAEIATKLDEKFDTIMSKYDDAQIAAEEQVKNMEERTAEQQVLLQSAKEVSEELKLSVDTLGTTLTAMETHFAEIGEKISSDSQTVFTKLDSFTGGLENLETREAAQNDHELTRAEVAKALDVVNGLSSETTEFHPKFLVALQELHALVEKHHEQAQKAQETAQEQARTAEEHSRSLAEEVKSSFSGLPALLPAPQPAIEAASTDVYDDAQVQEKLNQLLEGLGDVKNSSVQLERLDMIHQQVMTTAAEVSAFVTTQTRLIDEGHESKQKEAEEVALLLERRSAEKEHLEGTIADLVDEKESLLALIETLQSERDALATQKSRLAADVAAMQTALSIRQEELDAMDSKAEALERRVLEGIMDQSRLLMMAKSVKGATNPAPAARMASNASHSTIGQLPTLSAAGQGLSMALKTRPVGGRRNAGLNVANGTARRVMSLNPISANTPTGAQGFNAATRNIESGFIKRSQSVRTNKNRKTSWNSAPDKQQRAVSIHELVEDKENDVISEVNSEDEHEHSEDDEDTISESGTVERRMSSMTDGGSRPTSSYAGSVSEDSERPTSSGTMTGSEVSGSYMTGSEVSDRRTSYASTMRSTLGAGTVIDEEDEEGSQHEEDVSAVGAAEESEAEISIQRSNSGIARKDMVVYAAPSDSGLGTELPTAAMSGCETDYFRRKAEESASEV
jgi:peptidoglycan hydrolase CwlO-like protein